MPPSRTIAPYSPTRTPPASRRSLGHKRHLPHFIPVTNPLERFNKEIGRRTDVVGIFPGKTSCLTLVWAVLDLYITHATNGIKLTQLERQRLRRLRDEGHEPAPEEVNAA